MKLKLVGDIHGDIQAIQEIRQSSSQADLTIQIGDFGIGFGAENQLSTLDPNVIKILHGNHDNPDLLSTFPHDLGRFGTLELNNTKIFYIAGADSIDKNRRILCTNWWPNEELSFKEGEECLSTYDSVKNDIDIIISHEAPTNAALSLLGTVPRDTFTSQLLHEIWEIKQPTQWYFGHYHTSWQNKIGTTKFQCLSINESLIFEV